MPTGIAAWLRAMAKHKVKVVLIDTVEKSKGFKLLRTKDEPKGLLSLQEISHLAALSESLGIKALWAGGITGPQAFELGRLGVFGIYVTTAAAITVPVKGKYARDPGLAARKLPTFAGVLKVKTLLEAGYLSRPGQNGASSTNADRDDVVPASLPNDLELLHLANSLPGAWRKWWRARTPH